MPDPERPIGSSALLVSPLTLVATPVILAGRNRTKRNGVSEMIAEVHQIKFPSGATGAPSVDANNLAAEASQAPGSAQLLTLVDTSTGEGLVIHLWNDQASYDAFAARRKQMIADSEELGSHVEPARFYEVTYNG